MPEAQRTRECAAIDRSVTGRYTWGFAGMSLVPTETRAANGLDRPRLKLKEHHGQEV